MGTGEEPKDGHVESDRSVSAPWEKTAHSGWKSFFTIFQMHGLRYRVTANQIT